MIQSSLVLVSSGSSSLFLAYGTLSLLKHNRDGENGWNLVLDSFGLSLAGRCPFLFLFWWSDNIFWLNACFWFLPNGYERISQLVYNCSAITKRGCEEKKVLTTEKPVALNLFYLTYFILAATLQEFQSNDGFCQRKNKGIIYHHYEVVVPICICIYFFNIFAFLFILMISIRLRIMYNPY